MTDMRIIRYQAGPIPGQGERGQMMCVDTYDAMRIIESLASQVRNKSPNTGRAEFWAEVTDTELDTTRREYFSISVDPPTE